MSAPWCTQVYLGIQRGVWRLPNCGLFRLLCRTCRGPARAECTVSTHASKLTKSNKATSLTECVLPLVPYATISKLGWRPASFTSSWCAAVVTAEAVSKSRDPVANTSWPVLPVLSNPAPGPAPPCRYSGVSLYGSQGACVCARALGRTGGGSVCGSVYGQGMA